MFDIKETDRYKIFTIFGIKITLKKKTDIDKIVWWIPIKKYRTILRDLYYKIEYSSNNINRISNDVTTLNDRISNDITTLNDRISNDVATLNDRISNDVTTLNDRISNNFIFHLSKITPKSHIDFIEIALSEHCNLNCYSCNHFSQFAEEEYCDIIQFEKDINRLYLLTNGLVNRFSLMGGEPLLNKNCKEYFYILRSFFKNSSIWLVTNGILLNKQNNEFWESCRINNIEIRPTKYHININWNEIKKICDEYGIILKFFNGDNVERKMDKTILNLDATSNTFINFINCYLANHCVTLKKGKLFTCGLPSNIEHFNKFFKTKLEVTEFDYLDIYQVNNYEEILQFLSKPTPFCRYCDITKWYSINEWKISKKDINEYIETRPDQTRPDQT